MYNNTTLNKDDGVNMMGQKILCNNVLKLIANRNKCVKSISYDVI